MVKNRKLSRAISDLGWRTFRTFLEGKAEKYGRDFRVISRWEPTSYGRCMQRPSVVVDLKVENYIYQFVSGNVLIVGLNMVA